MAKESEVPSNIMNGTAGIKNIAARYVLAFLAIQFINFNYSIFLEEFRDYYSYVSIMEGNLPYRDYRWVYGPLGPFIYALIFKLFGSELIVLRLTLIFLGCIGIVLAYRISKFVMPKRWAALSGFLAIFCFLKIPPHTYNHFFGTLANLAATIAIFRFIKSSKSYNLFLAGILLNISILIHPITFGAEMFLSILIWLILFALITRSSIAWFFKYMVLFLIGAATFTIPVYAFILSKISYERVFELVWSHIRYPARLNIGLSKIIPTPDLLLKLRSIRYVLWVDFVDPFILYLLIFIVPLIAIALGIHWIKNKKNNKLVLEISFLAILTLSSMIYFLYSYNIGPITLGLGGFYFQYPIILLMFLIYRLFTYLSSNNFKTLNFLWKLCCVSFALMFLFFYHGYRISNFFIKRWTMPGLPSIAGIYLDEDEVKRYIEPSKYIKDNSSKGDKLFVTFYDPTYYILSGLPPIFPENIYIGLIPYSTIVDSSKLPRYKMKYPMKIEDLIIERLKEEGPKFIVQSVSMKYVYRPPSPSYLDFLSKHSIGPRAEKYIFENYILSKTFPFSNNEEEIRIYKRAA